MANDAEPYIAAVADACQAAGLNVLDYWSDDIDPRDGAVHLSVKAEASADEEDWELSRTLGWDEEKGWMYGEPKDSYGELCNLLWLCSGALPDPAGVAAAARKIITGDLTRDEQRLMMEHTRWRDQEDDDGFDAELAAYRDKAEAAKAARSCDVTALLGGVTYTCRQHDPDGTHHFAKHWPACGAPWCLLEPGHRELHNIPWGTPVLKDGQGNVLKVREAAADGRD